jgi:hypothetical protein
MKHRALSRFWQHYGQLPKEVRERADKNFELQMPLFGFG